MRKLNLNSTKGNKHFSTLVNYYCVSCINKCLKNSLFFGTVSTSILLQFVNNSFFAGNLRKSFSCQAKKQRVRFSGLCLITLQKCPTKKIMIKKEGYKGIGHPLKFSYGHIAPTRQHSLQEKYIKLLIRAFPTRQ